MRVEGGGKGLQALVGHTAEGLSNTGSKLTRGIAGVLANATLDKNYQRKRHAMMNANQGGVKQGMNMVGQGFKEGLSGVFKSPLKGVQKHGAAGLFKGTVQGVLGVRSDTYIVNVLRLCPMIGCGRTVFKIPYYSSCCKFPFED